MAEAFDPYHKWLGISPKDQPPHYYRLLGIDLFEPDPDVIASAADQRMAHVRSFQTSKNSALSQKILNEISSARICLLNAGKKAGYDAKLREEIESQAAAASATAAQTEASGSAAPAAAGLDLSSFEIPVAKKQRKPEEPKKSPPALKWAAGGILLVAAAAGAFLVVGNLSRPSADQSSALSPDTPPTTAGNPAKPDAKAKSKETPGPKHSGKKNGEDEDPAGSDSTTGRKPRRIPKAKPRPGTKDPGETDVPPTPPEAPRPKPPKTEDQLQQEFAAAKTPEAFRLVAQEALRAADHALADSKQELATRVALLALGTARKSEDVQLAKRATKRYLDAQGPVSDAIREQAKRRIEASLPRPARPAIGPIAPRPGVPLKRVTPEQLAKLRRTEAVGGSDGQTFEIYPSEGMLLTGLEVTVGAAGGSQAITSIRAVFRSGQIRDMSQFLGTQTGTPVMIEAKTGYAIGGMVARHGKRLDAIQVVFMRITAAGLDPHDRYESGWIGGDAGQKTTTLCGDGVPIITIHGRVVPDLIALGFVQNAPADSGKSP